MYCIAQESYMTCRECTNTKECLDYDKHKSKIDVLCPDIDVCYHLNIEVKDDEND